MKHHPFDYDAKPTKQELFDRVVEFFAQPETVKCTASTGAFSGCVYTNLQTGQHCAVGYMLPQEALDTIGERRGDLNRMNAMFPGVMPAWAKDKGNLALLGELQAIHDYSGAWFHPIKGEPMRPNPPRVVLELASVAIKNKLKFEGFTDEVPSV